jgi:tape measure domain-containing protein
MADDKLLIEVAGLGFDNLVRDLDDLQGELTETAERAEKVGVEPIDLDTSEARRRIEALRDDFRRFAEEADDPVLIKARTEQAQKEMREVRRHLTEVRKAARLARREVVKIEKGAKSFGLLRSALKGAAGALQSFVGNLGAIAAERFFDAIRDGIVTSLKIKATLEGLGPALRNVAGGYDGAAQATEFLEKASDKLARPINELIPGFVKLAGATKGTAAEGELTQEIFENMLSAANALGVETQQLQGAMIGLSQVAGRDLLRDLTDVRQVTDAMPGVMQAWADAMGTTQSELRDLIERGAVPTADALQKLNEAFESIGAEAAAERLETLAGKFDILRTGGVGVGQAFADEVAPGLKAVLDELVGMEGDVARTAQSLGEMANVLLGDVAEALRINTALAEKQRGVFQELLGDSPFRELVADALKLTPALEPFGVALDSVGDSLQGLPEKGRVAFDEIVQGAVLASQGVTDATSEAAEGAAQDFLGLSQKAAESFRKQAEEAGVSAEIIEKTERELSQELVKINDETAKKREALREIRVRAERDQVEDIEKVEEALSRAVVEIVEETEKKRQEAVEERVRQAKEAAQAEAEAAEEQGKRLQELQREASQLAEERIDAERQAEDSIEAARTATHEATLETFSELAEKAGASAEERREIEESLADDLAELENELADKKADAVEKFQKKAEKSGADREQLERELTEKLVDLDADANRKREALLEKRLEAVRKAADEEIKALERVRKATEDLAKDMDKLFEGIGKAAEEGEAAGTGGGGGERLPVEESLERARDSVEGLRSELDQLQFGDAGGGLDPDRILQVAGALDDAALAVDDFATKAEASGGEYQDVTDGMRENATRLREGIRELVFENERFAEIFPQLDATAQESIARIVDAYGNLSEGAQVSDESARQVLDTLQAFLDTAGGASEGAGTLAGRLQELAGGADEAGEAAQRSADGIRAAADGIELAAGASEEAREGLERWKDEAADAADKMEGAGQAAGDAAEGVEKGGEAAAGAAEGVAELGEAAGDVGPKLDAVADAGQRIAEIQVPEDLPAQLGAIGEAAGTTAEAAGPLGESLVVVNGTLTEIAATVTTLSELTPGLQESITAGAEQVTALAESENLATLTEQLDKVKATLEVAAPLLETMATSAATFAEQGKPVAEAAETIQEALEGLAAEEVVSRLSTTAETLGKIQESLEKGADGGERMLAAVEGVTEKVDDAVAKLDELAKVFEERIPAGIQETENSLDSVSAKVDKIVAEVVMGLEEVDEKIDGSIEKTEILTDRMSNLANETARAADEAKRLAENLADAEGEEGAA